MYANQVNVRFRIALGSLEEKCYSMIECNTSIQNPVANMKFQQENAKISALTAKFTARLLTPI